MSNVSQRLSFVVLGEQSLLIQCCELLLARGHEVRAIVAENRRIAEWCAQHSIVCHDNFAALRDAPETAAFDYLLSITNQRFRLMFGEKIASSTDLHLRFEFCTRCVCSP